MLRVLLNHIFPFVVAFFGGVATFYLLVPIDGPAPFNSSFGTSSDSVKNSRTCWGKGYGYGSGSGSGSFEPSTGTTKTNITFKPLAKYTDAARVNNIEGTVTLKVTLLANGEVGSIVPVTRLPHGLTEQAIAAARKIEFEPKRVDGAPVTTVATIEYSFHIY